MLARSLNLLLAGQSKMILYDHNIVSVTSDNINDHDTLHVTSGDFKPITIV